MIGSLLIITGGLVLFALGAERIVRSSDAMARRLGFTPFFYALTVVALATSLPELVVNSAHAVRGNYSLGRSEQPHFGRNAIGCGSKIRFEGLSER